MRVSIFGVGYVGCVSAACLARAGHQVVGVDIDPLKVSTINAGRSPFFEPGLNELIAETVAAGRLRATTDEKAAILESDLALVCVGTPSGRHGVICLEYLKQVFGIIGKALRDKPEPYVVVLRSTVLPNAIEDELLPILTRYAGKNLGNNLWFAYNPEFLREGTALKDFEDPAWTIVGSSDARASQLVSSLYEHLSAPLIQTDPQTAVLIKYFSNAFHAMKVAFANEVSQFCREACVDSRKLMEMFSIDTKLNISPRYLKPGFAFGGSCLPKDLRALMSEAGKRGFRVPLLESILVSNERHLHNCIDLISEIKKHRIGIVGLAFKQGTDDLRESPAVEMAERLIGKGFDVRIFEPTIDRHQLHGSNLMFIEKALPHVWKLLVKSLAELFIHSDLIVVTQEIGTKVREQFCMMRRDQICLDLAGALSAAEVSGEYRTIDGQPTTVLSEAIVA